MHYCAPCVLGKHPSENLLEKVPAQLQKAEKIDQKVILTRIGFINFQKQQFVEMFSRIQD